MNTPKDAPYKIKQHRGAYNDPIWTQAMGVRRNPKSLGRRQKRKLGLIGKPDSRPQSDGSHLVYHGLDHLGRSC